MNDSRRVVLAGGSGLIGSALLPALLDQDYEPVVLSRRPDSLPEMPAKVRVVAWDGRTQGDWSRELDGARAVINLAGAGVADKRWTARRKDVLLRSRLEPTLALVEAIRSAEIAPEVLLQGSAVGYYGSSPSNGSGGQGGQRLVEMSPPGDDFLARLTTRWEDASAEVQAFGVRRVLLRTGLVLDAAGGVLAKMLTPIKAGLGGRFGDGQQAMPWIHSADEVGAILFLLERRDLSGPALLVAPNPVTQADFVAAVGRALHRPTFLPVPAFALRLLLGDLAEALLGGQWATPERLLGAGFEFRYPTLPQALADLLRD